MKKQFMYVLAGSIIASTLFTAGDAGAEVKDTAQTDVKIEFGDAPTDAVAPKDPNDPTKELSEENQDGSIGGIGGPLSLDYVSNLDFGLRDMTVEAMDYNAKTTAPYLQVSDRRGTGTGWNVTAQLQRFTQGEKETLEAASLTLAEGEVESANTAAGNAPEVNSAVELISGKSSAKVVSANPTAGELKEAQGLGTWLTSWLSANEENEKVQLHVPANSASPGAHAAKITWTLSDGPGN